MNWLHFSHLHISFLISCIFVFSHIIYTFFCFSECLCIVHFYRFVSGYVHILHCLALTFFFPDATKYNSFFYNHTQKFSFTLAVQIICFGGYNMSMFVLYFCHHVLYYDEVCIKNKSDIPCTFKFIYKAVHNTFISTEVSRRKRQNLNFFHWIDVREEFQSREISFYDYITDRTLSGATTLGQSGLGSDRNEGVLRIP